MAPFSTPTAVIRGFKDKIESLTIQGDRVYIGTSLGGLHIFDIDPNDDAKPATLVTKKNLSRKPVEQLGFIKDVNSIIALTESTVTLLPLPNLVPPTPLAQARYAFSFAVNSNVQHVLPDGKTQAFEDGGAAQITGVPTMVTHLAVGCQKKLVIYSWRDGEAQGVKEAVLPHSPRAIAFVNSQVLCLAYTATEHVIFFMETMTTSDLTLPSTNMLPATGIGSMGMVALSGLGGYMTLGLGAKAKPFLIKVGDNEVLVPKDQNGLFIGADGKPSRTSCLEWPASPEELAFVKPYVFAIMPSGSVPVVSSSDSVASSTQAAFIPAPVVQIRSSISLALSQSLPWPFPSASPSAPNTNYNIRLLTPSPIAKSPLYVVTVPVERNAAATEGSTVWLFRMKSWSEQIDELVAAQSYADALALLNTVDKATLPDKQARQEKIRALHAVSQFRLGDYENAINTFIELNINPAKVVALFPESISGRLHIPQDRWIPLFGGPEHEQIETGDTSTEETSVMRTAEVLSPMGSVRGKLKTSLDAIMPTSAKDDDTASLTGSIREKPTKEKPVDNLKRSVETLLLYLSDRRPKVHGALALVNITPAQSHQFPPLSETSVDDVMSLPNMPISSLTPEQLTRFAQIIDTALFKSYLLIRPGLLAPLCRNTWCEVSEVEEVLQEREKYAELIFLYNGRKMHGQALALLRRLSDKETDQQVKLIPTISYLQKLGPDCLDQIFESSRWVFEQDPDKALEIFTSEQTELPRSAVADFLEEIDPEICMRYLEYLISERDENSELFHDRLAELYLDLSTSAKRRGDTEVQEEAYAKLLHFIEASEQYRTDRLFGLLPSEDMFEARAILLGRLGKHDGALEIYVYRLHDYIKAEEYCKRIYRPDSRTKDVFLALLKIYLSPPPHQASDLLQPALDLISRQSPRLDTIQTLQLLPPLVNAHDVKAFLYDALRIPVFDTRVLREIGKARNEQVAAKLMLLQSKRVKVTDSRICPQCHKRIGNSVIAVHAPKGEVTHYQCREAFSRKLVERS